MEQVWKCVTAQDTMRTMARDIKADIDFTAAAAMPVRSPEVAVMTGTHFHSLDEKGRVIIPAKLRSALTEQFWMMLDEHDNICLYNYRTGLSVLERCEQLMAENSVDRELALSIERITGNAEAIAVDSGFRVQIPETLRYLAGLDKEVVTVGVLNHAVLWDREKWEARQTSRLQDAGVRRTQGGIMRGAASMVKKAQEAADANEQAIEISEVEIERASAIGRAIARAAKPEVEADASAGHGGRSPGLLKMSKPGR